MKDVFELNTQTQKKFICNRETGRWVLANQLDSEILEKISVSIDKGPFTDTSLIVLNIGRQCNFDCAYCYLGNLKREGKQMPIEIGRKIIDQVSELKQDKKQVVFHGSEPLLNFSLIKDLVDYSKKNYQNINFCLQTNGSLLDEEKLEFLSQEGITAGISLDGLKLHQDQNRPYIGGISSYSDVSTNLSQLKQYQKGVSIITVITRENVGDLEKIVADFKEKGIDSVLFSLVGSKDKSVYPDLEMLSKKMKLVLDNYIDSVYIGRPTIKIRNLRDMLRTFLKNRTTTNCVQCGGTQSHPLMAVDIDGSIYPCDFFCGIEEYKIGNIFSDSLEESFNSKKNFRVYRNIETIEECSECDWKRFCGGGCAGISVLEGRGITSKSYYCDYFKKIFSYVAGIIPVLHEKRLIKTILS